MALFHFIFFLPVSVQLKCCVEDVKSGDVISDWDSHKSFLQWTQTDETQSQSKKDRLGQKENRKWSEH